MSYSPPSFSWGPARYEMIKGTSVPQWANTPTSVPDMYMESVIYLSAEKNTKNKKNVEQ